MTSRLPRSCTAEMFSALRRGFSGVVSTANQVLCFLRIKERGEEKTLEKTTVSDERKWSIICESRMLLSGKKGCVGNWGCCKWLYVWPCTDWCECLSWEYSNKRNGIYPAVSVWASTSHLKKRKKERHFLWTRVRGRLGCNYAVGHEIPWYRTKPG